MNQMTYRGTGAAIVGLLLLVSSGCSTLGLSLYPSGAVMTKESKAVLDASRVPVGIARENAKTVRPPHVLQPGDSLLIEPEYLERDLRLPADQLVMADGTVDLGPYGRTIVAGRNLEQAESLIEQQILHQMRVQRASCQPGAAEENEVPSSSSWLSEDCNAVSINVRLLEPVHRFYVLGEVNAPGAYPLSGYETVLDAIVAAGGLTGSANPCQILLARPSDPCECRVTLPVCYREIVQMGNTATNYQLQPGDRVFVASRSCLDELMFWRASRPCKRCVGCNQACRYPEMLTTKSMPMVQNPMIPPGSVGWTPAEDDLTQSNGFVEPALVESDPSKLEAATSESDVDGELEFVPLTK